MDGIALKRAVDNWVSVPAAQKPSALAAAEAVRWVDMGMNGLSYFLVGLTLLLFGLAIALGSIYPRWAGLIAALSGVALMYNGVIEVAFQGFVGSIIKLVGLALLALWAIVMGVLMWHDGGRRRIARLDSSLPGSPQRPASPR